MKRKIPFIVYIVLWCIVIIPVVTHLRGIYDIHCSFIDSLCLMIPLAIITPILNIITIILLIIIYRNNKGINKYIFDIIPLFLTILATIMVIVQLPPLLQQKVEGYYFVILSLIFPFIGIIINHVTHKIVVK